MACLTREDWEGLTERYKKSKKKKADKELFETLSDGFLPEIVKMFAEKEREVRRRLLSLAPKRASSRIERKKQEQEEKDRIEAERVRLFFFKFFHSSALKSAKKSAKKFVKSHFSKKICKKVQFDETMHCLLPQRLKSKGKNVDFSLALRYVQRTQTHI